METNQAPVSEHLNRRSFLRRAGLFGAGSAMAAAGLGSASKLFGTIPDPDEIPQSDIDILNFLAAAELVEADLWLQYTELSAGNGEYRRELIDIDPALPRYINDDYEDELSHANFINGFLVAIGQPAVNLDPFRTLEPSQAFGSNRDLLRLTTLKGLTVDTSWFNRYRSPLNPDLESVEFQQLVDIEGQATIPLNTSTSPQDARLAAYCAAFHFNAIEQGGASLYCSLMTKVSSLPVLQILLAIGPTEFYHFATFHESLQGIGRFGHNGVVFPNLERLTNLSEGTFPEPCSFIDMSFPRCSVVRPTSTEKAGAVAAATGLVNSGLFTGQSPAFLNAVVALAQAADAATRSI